MQQVERTAEVHASVTSKGQVTIPVEIRRYLGVRPRDTVAFRIKGNEVHLIRSGSVVQATAGALAGPGPRVSARKERAAAEDAIAQEALEHSRG